MPPKRPWSIFLAIALAPAGCGRPQAKGDKPVAGPSSAPATATANPAEGAGKAPVAASMPTKAEAVAFAREVEKAVAAHDRDAFSAMVDWEAILDSATEGLGALPASRKGFAEGVMGSLKRDEGIVGVICGKPDDGANRLKFLRTREEGGRRRILFRLTPGTGGVAYYELVLGRPGGGKLRAVDLYVYTTGELVSQTLRRAYLPLAAHDTRGLLDRLAGRDQDLFKHFPKFQKMAEDANAGRNREAIAAFQALPASLKADKNALILRLRAAIALGGDDYSAAIDDFQAAHPNDPALDLILIDGYSLKKRYDKAIARVDRLDERIGGDPYLDVLRAGLLMEKGDLPAAEEAARRATQREPALLEGFWTLVAISLKERAFDKTLALLRSIEADFRLTFGDLATEPDYAEFVKSPQGREWLEGHPQE